MKFGFRRTLYTIVTLLALLQAVLPPTAMASIAMRCVGMSPTAPPCAQASVDLAHYNAEASMANMPCCNGMQRAKIAPATSQLHLQTLSERRCIITTSWASAVRQAPVFTKSQHLNIASSSVSVYYLKSHSLFNCDVTFHQYSRSGFSLHITTAFLRLHGLRAPPPS